MNDAKQTLLADRKLFLSWVKLQQIRMSDLLRYAVLVMSKFSTWWFMSDFYQIIHMKVVDR